MKEEFEIIEKGSDIWGRKTYNVTKKSDNSSGSMLGYLFLTVLGMAILTLPSGIIALVLYIPLKLLFLNSSKIENLSEKKEKLAWGSIITGIIAVAIYYYYYFDIEKMMGAAILACILGVFAYYILYKLVTWENKSDEEKETAKQNIKKLSMKNVFIWGGLFLIYKFTTWIDFMKPMVNSFWDGFIKPIISNLIN